MAQRLLIAFGAGLAAAILFVVPIKGTAFAMLVAFLAALPIMIAGLGFGQMSALIAGAVGAIAIGIFLHPLFGAVFVLSLAFPSWWLARLASLCRPVDEGSAQVVWYPIGRLLGWIVILSVGITLTIMALVVLQAGGYGDFVDSTATRMAPAIESLLGAGMMPAGYSTNDFARLIVALMPSVMAGWSVVSLAVNLWLAGRVVLISQLLTRTWEDLPQNLEMPIMARQAFAISLLGCLIDGPLRMVGSTVAAALGIAYMFQGLAAIHFITRGSAARTPVLMGVYFTMVVMLPWPMLLAAATGLAETFYPLRRPKAPPTPPTPPTPNH